MHAVFSSGRVSAYEESLGRNGERERGNRNERVGESNISSGYLKRLIEEVIWLEELFHAPNLR